MPDKVKPLGFETLTDGDQTVPVPTELDVAEDYVTAKGVAFENLDTHLIDRVGDDIQFTDPAVGIKSVDQVQSTARVSANDTTPDNLLAKIAPGDAITLVETNDGGNETLTTNVAINPEALVAPAPTDEVLIADASDSFNIKKATTQAVAELALIDVEEDDISTVTNVKTLNFEGALVSVVDEGGGKATISVGVNVGAILAALFSSTANNVGTKFLDTENVASSDNLPAVMSLTANITKITFSNQNSTPSGTIEIRKNTTVGTPLISVALGGTQTEVFTVSAAVTEADQINCKVVGGSGVQKPLVKAYV